MTGVTVYSLYLNEVKPVYVSESDGRRMLEPFMARLRQAIDVGDAGLNEMFGTYRHLLKRRSIASVRNDLVSSVARELFASDNDVWFTTSYGRDVMHIADKAAVLFKQIDSLKRTSNIPTQLVMNLYGQQELPNLPAKEPRFVAGWQMDRLGVAVQGAYVTFPLSPRRIAWAVPLTDTNAGSAPITQIVPPTPLLPTGTTKRVRVKTDKVKKARKNGTKH